MSQSIGQIGMELAKVLLTVGVLAFLIWMIVDFAKHEKSTGQLAIWMILIIGFWIIGAPLYFMFRYIPRRARENR